MTAEPTGEPTGPAREKQRGSRGRFDMKHLGFTAVVAGAVSILVASWIWRGGSEERAVRHLSTDERRQLYDRPLQTLRGPCTEGKDANGLSSFCREQALFIVKFPECDDACVALARVYLPPTK